MIGSTIFNVLMIAVDLAALFHIGVRRRFLSSLAAAITVTTVAGLTSGPARTLGGLG